MSTPSQPIVTLNTGAKMPAIGLGCWSGLTEEERIAGKEWILTALQSGYRHMDTAYDYGTEGSVGRALRESGIPREEVFITTKLPLHHHAHVAQSLEESLQNGGFEYYDLWLMHWPQAFAYIDNKPNPRHPGPNGEPDEGEYIIDDKTSFNETWADMEKVYKTGKVKAIGVSNFSVKNLKTLLETANIVPAVNQVECHPHQAQPELLEFCKKHGIMLTAYTPSGYKEVVGDTVVRGIADKYKVSSQQVTLAWHVARGISAIPKSSNAERQKANLWERPQLDGTDIDALNKLHRNAHYCFYPGVQERNGKKLVFGWTYEEMGW